MLEFVVVGTWNLFVLQILLEKSKAKGVIDFLTLKLTLEVSEGILVTAFGVLTLYFSAKTESRLKNPL